jgi:deazaflavin-dependent oxidoreductase (nitroreductase family)
MNLLMKAFVSGHVFLYRSSSGRLGATLGGLPVLLLTTRGRKTGKERTVPLVPFVDGERTYVMASMGGQPQNPAWFANIEKDPSAEMQRGGTRRAVRARILPREERDVIWPRITTAMPNFGEYQKKTERVIPVVELCPAS